MSEAAAEKAYCGGTWELTGRDCNKPAVGDTDRCSAHQPDGDHRPPPPPDESRCPATCKQTGERCRQSLRDGRKVCRFHGGKSPQAIEAANTRAIEERARELVRTYGRKIETTAIAALLEEVQWTAGHVAWLRERVQEIEEAELVSQQTADAFDGEGDDAQAPAATNGKHPLVWGITKVKQGGDDRGVTFEAAPNIWLKLYAQERTHLVKVCSEAIKAGIDERLVRVAEQQGSLVAQAIRAILGDLNLSPEQQAMVPTIVPRHLRALSG